MLKTWFRVGAVALVAMAARSANAEKARAKGSQEAAEMWIRYLGPASDPAEVRAGTAATLYAAIFDNDGEGETDSKSCSGTFAKDKLEVELACLSHHFALLEYDFAASTAKDLAALPKLLANEKAKIKETAKSARLMIHSYDESGMHEVVIVGLVKGRGGKSLVSAVWKAAWHEDDGQ
jgi:hypothetical protein